MNENMIITDLQRFIVKNILAGDVILGPETALQNAGIDSFSLVEILLFIQEKYEIQVPDNQMLPDNFKSLTSLARMVSNLSLNQ